MFTVRLGFTKTILINLDSIVEANQAGIKKGYNTLGLYLADIIECALHFCTVDWYW